MDGTQMAANPTTRNASVPCQDCQHKMTVPFSQAIFLHALEVSTIILPHLDAIVCGNCGAIYGLGINEKLTKVVPELRQVKKGSLIASPHANGNSGLILPS